jgi:hypothetical protein
MFHVRTNTSGYAAWSMTLALVLAGSAAAVEPIPKPLQDAAALEHWVIGSLDCKADFLEGLQNRAYIERLKALGVKLTTEWQEGDVPEGEFDLPKPVAFAGQSITHIHYWGDSGAEFYGTVTAAPEEVAKALQAKPVAAKNRHDFDERTIAARFVSPVPKGESHAPAVFVRRSEDGKQTEVGCRYFDG